MGQMEARELTGACTIVSPNYLPFARTLALSYRAHHPVDEFFVLIVGRIADKSAFAEEPYTAVFLEEIGLQNIQSLGMKYNILELNTNVKPRFMLYLLAQRNISMLVYLDPDIYVYLRLQPVFDLLCHHNAVLTPHLTTPSSEPDGGFEQDVLSNGTYNLGFFAVRRNEETTQLLEWWDRRCVEKGFSEGRSGLFVDQKWMNLAPSLFDGVVQCKHPGCNMGVWNLDERKLSVCNGRYVVNGQSPLYFFHFSGVAVDRPEVLFRFTHRHTPSSRPDLQQIFAEYKEAVSKNRVPALDEIPYGFDRFDDGTAVTLIARRIYAAHEKSFSHEDPFQSNSDFYRFAQRHGLTAGKVQQPRIGWEGLEAQGRRVTVVHLILKFTLKLLGPNRYELLMKYLGFISILRNQAVFIKD